MILINSEEFKDINIQYVRWNREDLEKVTIWNKKVKGMYQEYREDVERIDSVKEIDIENNFYLV